MIRAVVRAAVFTALLASGSFAFADDPARLQVGKGERLLVVAPHPDDETLAAGGLIQRVRERGGKVQILVVTAGDGWVEAVRRETGRRNPTPSEYVAYGEKRLHEVRAAALKLGRSNLRLQILGFPDGELDDLLGAHWTQPDRSVTTGASDPPYDAEAVQPDVPYDGNDLRHEMERILSNFRPTIVALPDPLDRHPDHRATGLFTLIAVDEWSKRGEAAGAPMPRLLAYLVHWPAWPPGWDTPQTRPEDSNSPLSLPANFRPDDDAKPVLTLTNREIANKRTALAQHKTQREVMGTCLDAFVRRTEPFTLLTSSEVRRAEYVVAERLRTTRTR